MTAAYSVADRRWSDLRPAISPPPVMAGSLAYDSVNDEMVLFGGGHVAEKGPNGKLAGYTGTWVYEFENGDWRQLETGAQPPPRMNTRLVTDSKNQVLVLFGGDGQSHYLSDTWLYDMRTRHWRQSKAPGGPEPRAEHFTIYDEQTGWVIIGGGYNREDLNDMWAYDAAEDRWRRLVGDVPTAFYIAGDIAPERRLIVLVTNTRAPGDRMTCNVLFPARTTYGYRIERDSILHSDQTARAHEPMPKRPPLEAQRGTEPDPARERAQADRLRTLPVNQWVHLENPGRAAPSRTWGSATLDTDRGRILYWGGGHCGYGGSDVDAYDIAAHTWLSGNPTPEYPERAWKLGVRSAGVTFAGKPWMTHGRRIYSYDPVSRKMIMVRPIRLTTGYDPEALRVFPEERRIRPDAVANPPSSYAKYATYSYDSETGDWELLGGAPAGLDTLASTPHGVVGIDVDWPSRLNDAGYSLPWSPAQPPEDKALYLFDPAKKVWKRLGERQTSPQNLYEMTSLAYDTKRDQIILHGGGQNREELWSFDLKTNRWKNMKPRVLAPEGAAPPTCGREAVYIPRDDVYLIYGRAPGSRSAPAMWAYKVSENAWRRIDILPTEGVEPSVAASQNRALVCDEQRDLVLLVLGTRGDSGEAHVFALRYRHDQAPLVPSGAE